MSIVYKNALSWSTPCLQLGCGPMHSPPTQIRRARCHPRRTHRKAWQPSHQNSRTGIPACLRSMPPIQNQKSQITTRQSAPCTPRRLSAAPLSPASRRGAPSARPPLSLGRRSLRRSWQRQGSLRVPREAQAQGVVAAAGVVPAAVRRAADPRVTEPTATPGDSVRART